MRRLAPLCLLAACSVAPSPLAEAARQSHVDYTAGGWLQGLVPSAIAGGAPVGLEVVVFAVRGELPGGLATDATATILAGHDAPFRGAAAEFGDLRWLGDTAAGAWLAGTAARPPHELQQLGRVTAVAAPGLRTRCRTDGLPDVLATMAGGELHLAVGRTAGELLLLQQPLTRSAPVGLLSVPTLSPDRPSVVVALRRLEGPSAEAVAAARAAATPPAEPGRAPDPLAAQLGKAADAIGLDNRRPALLAVAQRLRATGSIDLLQALDPRAAAAVTAELPGAETLEASRGPAWRFERAVWLVLLPRIQRDDLPDALRNVLRQQLGALADDPSALELLVRSSDGPEEFARGVREENLAALADRDAGPRVRGHDWLADHGGAVPGYDPLGPRAGRQQALRAAAAAARAAEAPR